MPSALPCLDPISIGTFRVDPFLLRLVFTPILGVTFVESFSRLDREFDKPMIFFRLS
jgi:hypothetical protein